MPKCWNYSNRNTQSWAFQAGPIEMYFSYRTCVAFRDPATGRLLVCENDWGPTTGRHLNELDDDDRENRLPHSEFVQALDAFLDSVVLLPTVEVAEEILSGASAPA